MGEKSEPKIRDITREQVEEAMKNKNIEEPRVSTFWYRGVYVLDNNKQKRYGVKNLCFHILGHRNFNSQEARRRLDELGFTTDKDETVPRSGWKKKWMKEKVRGLILPTKTVAS